MVHRSHHHHPTRRLESTEAGSLNHFQDRRPRKGRDGKRSWTNSPMDVPAGGHNERRSIRSLLDSLSVLGKDSILTTHDSRLTCSGFSFINLSRSCASSHPRSRAHPAMEHRGSETGQQGSLSETLTTMVYRPTRRSTSQGGS